MNNITETRNETIENINSKVKGLEEIEIVEVEVLETPDYNYGLNQNTLDAKTSLRNIPNSGAICNTGLSAFISGDTSIEVGFKPSVIIANVYSSNGVSNGSATSNSNQSCVAVYKNTDGGITTDLSNSRLFRTSGNETGSLVSIDDNGFTINANYGGSIQWTCIK